MNFCKRNTSEPPLLPTGQLEVLLERRLSMDDTLGMGEGVLDNVRTRSVFRLLLESFNVH